MGKYYRHFKENIYKILHIAKDSETLEDIVIYQTMYGKKGVWVRPKDMFVEIIEMDGKLIRRFTEISDDEAEAAIKKDL